MIGYLYEGLGNTFVITENIDSHRLSKLAVLNCQKYQLDGLINYNQESNKMSIYNKDGSAALMCGNGIRCLANHIYKKNKNESFHINTDAGIKEIKVISNNFSCQVNLGRPRIIQELNSIKSIKINQKEFHINALFLSTFQIIIIVNDINSKDILDYAEQIFHYKEFNNKCNITFCELVSYNCIKTKTYERGVGFTSSCGTGASASAYICYLLYNLSSSIKVKQELGELQVDINQDIYLTGPSNYIGEIILDE